MDEIALVLIARMYKVHIASLMSEKYWTTQRNHDISKCQIELAFRGNLTFNDTRKRPKTLPHPSKPSFHYRLRSTTEKEREEKKLSANNQDKNNGSNKNQQGKVVIRTHGIPKKFVKQRVFKCHLCGDRSSVSEKFLSLHYKQKHPNFSFQCQYCNKICNSRNNLRRHENSHAAIKHECITCKRRFQYPSALKVHIRTHTQKNLVPCLYCKTKFTTNSDEGACQKTHSSLD